MKEKEPRQSFLTWKAALIVLASAGAGYMLGSKGVREEISLRCRAARNVIRRRNEMWTIQKKAGEILRRAYPQGM